MPHADPDVRRAYLREWKRKHRGRYRFMAKTYDAARHANERAAAYGVPGTLTADDVRELFRDAHCTYCGSPERLTVDHIIPMSRGGHNVPANIQPACHGCNSSKFRGPRPGRWARRHAYCRDCGGTDRRHLARGLCAGCHPRWRHRVDRGRMTWSEVDEHLADRRAA